MAALMIFTVSYAGIRLKVRVLPTVRDVHKEYESNYTDGKAIRRSGNNVDGFFAPTVRRDARFFGTVVLPLNGCLPELIPHEVGHVVRRKMGVIDSSNEERFCMAIGILSSRIARKIKRGVAA